jgi:hypothetical protein
LRVTEQFFHRQHVPDWFFRFVNSNVLFTGIPTVAVVLLLVGLRLITRRAEGVPSRWTDFDFGLQLVIAAIVAVPVATTLRVSKEIFELGGTKPRATIEISAAILVSLVIVAVVLARAAGARRALGPDETPTRADLAFGVFVPNLAGIFAVMLVLLFASRGGTVHG